MNIKELKDIIDRGEDSQHQFKEFFSSSDALSSELVALSNSLGGMIIVGVKDDGSIVGLTNENIRALNNLLSNVASEGVKPAINPISEIIIINEKKLMIIYVTKGLNKPYQDKNGIIWIKVGADKRKAIAREELQRIFQNSGMIHGDIMPAEGLTIEDVDMPYFEKFYNKRYESDLKSLDIPITNLFNNLYLAKDGYLNLTGALIFAKNPEYRLPVYIVKAVVYPFNTITEDTYIDSRDMTGKLEEIYDKTITFIMNNIHYIQGNQGVNSVGQPEIPRIVFEELLVNALVHRDYYISAPIKVFIFKDRIEIINPGNLPNNLTIENIKNGNSNVKNPVLASFAYHVLPYRGIGSGILRALKEYPDIEFINDLINNSFKCVIRRKTI